MHFIRFLIAAATIAALPTLGASQTNSIAFGTIKANPLLPVEVTADDLAVNQADGSAQFSGNVTIIQGVMRLSADRVLVIYKTSDGAEKTGIERLEAEGNVLLVNGPDAAEAERADYSIDAGTVIMSGDVLLTQGDSTLTSNRLVVDLNAGTASMAGRVKTTLNPGGN